MMKLYPGFKKSTYNNPEDFNSITYLVHIALKKENLKRH